MFFDNLNLNYCLISFVKWFIYEINTRLHQLGEMFSMNGRKSHAKII